MVILQALWWVTVYHLDVELSFPRGEESPKGGTVRPLIAYMI